MKKFLLSIILKIYRSPGSVRSRSPLDLPEKAIWFNFLLAAFISITLGNLIIRGLYWWAEAQLDSGGGVIVLSEKSETSEAKAAELTGLKISRSLPEDVGIEDLFKVNTIPYSAFSAWMNTHHQIADSDLKSAVLGYLEGWIFPIAEFPTTEESLRQFNFKKPDPSTLGKLESSDIHYYMAATCLDKFRKNLAGGYGQPLRLAQALAGSIQWLTVILAIWAALLMICRYLVVKLQQSLIQYGNVDILGYEEGNLWQIQQESPNAVPLFYRLERDFPNVFLAADLVTHVIQKDALEQSPLECQLVITEKVDELKSKVASSGFEIVDFVIYACPTLGFIGTKVGITEAFSHASQIISSNNTIDRVTAFDEVTKALAFSFDTSFVGLVAVLILVQINTILKRQEAQMFTLIERESFFQLKNYWTKKG